MPETAARRHEIERLRRRAEGHRRVAATLQSADASAAYMEAASIDRKADEMEAALARQLGGNVILFVKRA